MHFFNIIKQLVLLTATLTYIKQARASVPPPPCGDGHHGTEANLRYLLNGLHHVQDESVTSHTGIKTWNIVRPGGTTDYSGYVRLNGSLYMSNKNPVTGKTLVLIKTSGSKTFWLFSYTNECLCEDRTIWNYSEVIGVEIWAQDVY
jgi:hypothetical protein